MADVDIEAFEMVEEWKTAFNMHNTPSDLWRTLVEEEDNEVYEALANYLKEVCDSIWVLYGLQMAYLDEGNEEDANAIEDVTDDYVQKVCEVFGGELFLECFKEVFRSNMSKLGDDGKPVYREDGKILKGPNYSPADILSIVEKYAKA